MVVVARLSLGAAAALAVAVGGCSEDPRTITVEVTPGHEVDAFHEAPPVARMEVTVTAAEGDLSLNASAPPGGSLDFGEIPADRLLAFEARGLDAGGAAVVRGRSLSGIYLAGLDADLLPVFAQRAGRWGRPPGELSASRAGAPAAVLAERYLVLTGGAAADGGDPAELEAYDLLAWGGSASGPLPRVARSIVGRGSALLLVGDGGATWVDFSSGESADAAPPPGLASFAEVAGGRAVEAGDGRSFVVGATRAAGAPTAGVLVVEADGTLKGIQLAEARGGAAAAWVDGLGLVVAGGSATGPGVEVLGDGATAFTERPFSSDPVEGAAAVAVGLGEVVLVGGTLAGAPAPTRRLDPGCAVACAAIEIEGAALPAALTGVAAYALPGSRLIAVGDEIAAGGMTRSFVVDLGGATAAELPLREPRAGATPTPAPNGTLALLGGVHPDGTPAQTVEMLFPE